MHVVELVCHQAVERKEARNVEVDHGREVNEGGVRFHHLGSSNARVVEFQNEYDLM